MTWFKRKKDFPEEQDILGDDFEAEFDGIAEAFNGLFKAARVSASGNLSLGAAADVPGTAEAITPTIPSLLIVTADFRSNSSDAMTGRLNVDGSDQPQQVETTGKQGSESFCIKLSAGAHTVKLRASGTGTLLATHTGYTYLLIPEP